MKWLSLWSGVTAAINHAFVAIRRTRRILNTVVQSHKHSERTWNSFTNAFWNASLLTQTTFESSIWTINYIKKVCQCICCIDLILNSFCSTTSICLCTSARRIIHTTTRFWRQWIYVKSTTNSLRRRVGWRSCLEKDLRTPSSWSSSGWVCEHLCQFEQSGRGVAAALWAVLLMQTIQIEFESFSSPISFFFPHIILCATSPINPINMSRNTCNTETILLNFSFYNLNNGVAL